MKFYTQNISGNIGNTSWTIARYGCYGTCIGMILEVDPKLIFSHAEYFNSNGEVINEQKIADDFGGNLDTRRTDIGLRPTIVETRFDGSMHFVVWDGARFYDPLTADGHPLRDYQIISFRNFSKKGGQMTPEQLATLNALGEHNLAHYRIEEGLQAQIDELKKTVNLEPAQEKKLKELSDTVGLLLNNPQQTPQFDIQTAGVLQKIADFIKKWLKL